MNITLSLKSSGLSIAPLRSVSSSRVFTGLLFIADIYFSRGIFRQSIRVFISRSSIASSHKRVALPLPSLKGCAMFISVYFARMSAKLFCGISEITGRIFSRKSEFANLKPPFEMLTVVNYPSLKTWASCFIGEYLHNILCDTCVAVSASTRLFALCSGETFISYNALDNIDCALFISLEA